VQRRTATRTVATSRDRSSRPAVLLLTLAALLTATAVLAAHARAGGGVAQSRALVRVDSGSLGRMLVNANGRTLYLFTRDPRGKSACTGTCATFWHPVATSGKPRAAHGVSASLLGTTKRRDGRLQATYDGHALYTFELDTKAGQMHGEGLNEFGGKWYAVSPNGTKLVTSTPASTTPPPAPGYGP